jgi:hypothetical protein
MNPLQRLQDNAREITLPEWLKGDLRAAVRTAALLGWQVHLDSDHGVGIWSPGGHKRYHFTAKKSSGPINRIRRDVWRYGDPELVEVARQFADGEVLDPRKAMKIKTVEEVAVVHERQQAEPMDERNCQAFLEGVEHTQHRWYEDGDGDHLRPHLCYGYKEEASVTEVSEPTVVSQHPMVAKRGQGKAYDSGTTMVQTMSDGSTRYACRFEGCGYWSLNRKAVSGHWSRAKGHPNTEVRSIPPYRAEVPEAHPYAPRKIRVEALAQRLLETLSGEAIPTLEELAEALAQKALTWVHEQTGQGTGFAEEREPMTAEETLARIRLLLDTGESFTLRQENERLASQVAELTSRVEEARQEAERIRGNWQALSDLMAEMGRTEERQGA